MIANNGKYYLYRHIRLDKNEPFYIGVGQKENNGYRRITTEYRRAFVHFTRNNYWKSIVKNTNYSVEIVLESDDRSFIMNKEVEFISLYGRKDIGTGPLANMTDGGDYYNLDKKYTTQGRNKLTTKQRSEITKKSKRYPLGTNPVEIFIYCKVTGNFIKSYPQIKLAASELNLSKTRLSESLSKMQSYNKYVFSRVYMGSKINLTIFNIRKDKCLPVLQIHPVDFSIVNRFNSGSEAGKVEKLWPSNIQLAIKRNIKAGGYYWKYDDGQPFSYIIKRKSRTFKNNRL